MCGGETCDLGATGMFATACCTDDDACGMESPIASGCIALDQPGGIDAACEGFAVMGFTLPGCCGENGCGALLGAGTCASNEQLGLDPVECDFDPNNTCTALMDVPCDGSEDCPSGQQCCGRVDGTTYTEIGCFDSCEGAAADAGMGTLYLELCHAGDTCTNTAYSCGTSQYLPQYLLRCYETAGDPAATLSDAADEINCGDTTCGTGETCCIRSPKEPYCAPAGEDCVCTPASELPDGGADGGGGDGAGPDAGAVDAAPPEAGAVDAAPPDASGD
jgi:hypothetical protein